MSLRISSSRISISIYIYINTSRPLRSSYNLFFFFCSVHCFTSNALLYIATVYKRIYTLDLTARCVTYLRSCTIHHPLLICDHTSLLHHCFFVFFFLRSALLSSCSFDHGARALALSAHVSHRRSLLQSATSHRARRPLTSGPVLHPWLVPSRSSPAAAHWPSPQSPLRPLVLGLLLLAPRRTTCRAWKIG